jgi:hypothetical protein
MPASGAKGISSGLQPGGMSPSNESVAGELGKLDTPGAHSGAAGSPQPDPLAERADKDQKPEPRR